MILIDTNVLSEMMRRRPDPNVVLWFETLESRDLAISAITLFELRSGAAILPAAPERRRLSAMIDGLQSGRFGTIVPFDEDAAIEAAASRAYRRSLGRPVGIPDSLTAGAARSGSAQLATRNLRDFESASLVLIDPFQSPIS